MINYEDPGVLAHFILGMAYLNGSGGCSTNLNEAANELRHSGLLGFGDAWYYLSLACEQQGLRKDAAEYMNTASTYCNPYAMCLVAKDYMRAFRAKEAEQLFRDAIRLTNGDPEVLKASRVLRLAGIPDLQYIPSKLMLYFDNEGAPTFEKPAVVKPQNDAPKESPKTRKKGSQTKAKNGVKEDPNELLSILEDKKQELMANLENKKNELLSKFEEKKQGLFSKLFGRKNN